MDSRRGGRGHGGRKGGVTCDKACRGALLCHLTAGCPTASRGNVWRSYRSSPAPHHCGDGGGDRADLTNSGCSGCGVRSLRKSARLGQKDGVLANTLGVHQVCGHVVPHRTHYDPFQQHQTEPKAYEAYEKWNHTEPGLLTGPKGTGPTP